MLRASAGQRLRPASLATGFSRAAASEWRCYKVASLRPGMAAARTVIRLSFFGAFFRKKRRKNAPPHVSDYGRGPNAESGC